MPVLRAALRALLGGATAGLRPLRGRDVHLERAARREQRPGDDAELAEGIAAELAFARDELSSSAGGRRR